MSHSFSPSDFSRPYVQCKPDDRRTHPRVRGKGLVEMRFLEQDTRVTGILMDLSMTGCCIESPDELPAITGQDVEVYLSINNIRLRVAGKVCNVRRKRRAGIQFKQVNGRKADQIRQMVTDLVRQHLGLNGGK